MLAEVSQCPAELSVRGKAGIPRWADVTIAVLALIFLAPAIAVIGVAIALTSGTPVVFTQWRVGLNGEWFKIYKLRTMRVSVDGPQITSRNDGRVTRLGRLLRQAKLDELPTFWNVLRGDMSLVGPRPEVPAYVNLSDPCWRLILSVRPGLTDPITVSLRNEEDLLAQAGPNAEAFYVSQLQPAKLRGYIDYLQQRTVRSDVVVLFRTMAEIIRH
jgi:lipopolysaccharide/colanic/teichoic acid biosynthesis glycosyltransferase